jgi:aspartyl-tRNA synthetase
VRKNIIFRNKFLNFTRNWFFNNDFIEVQTPIFTVSSPEWARDYLVPSRLHPWKFYALPQAPQQYKQLLMVWGMDKYFQIAPCFRDEDTRADRHACEFYQIDAEMSFVHQEDIFKVAESYIFDLVKTISPNKRIKDNKIYTMTHEQSMNDYWTDKPDIRFGMKFEDITDIFKNTEFTVFKDIISKWWVIKAMKSEWIQMSRKDIDDLTEIAKKAWAKWLAYIIYDTEWPRSPILKFFSESEIKTIESKFNPKINDIIFFSANEFETAVSVLNVVRLAIRDRHNLVDKDELAFTWVIDFPMFELDKDTGKIDFAHNPFSMPSGGVKAFETEDILKIRANQYDLACNWYEVLSWSIRNYDIEAMIKAFEIVWRSADEVKQRFW